MGCRFFGMIDFDGWRLHIYNKCMPYGEVFMRFEDCGSLWFVNVFTGELWFAKFGCWWRL